MNENKIFLPLVVSLILHLFFAYLFFFGLPSFRKEFAESKTITVDVLPISELSNVKTAKAQKEAAIEAEKAKKVNKSKADNKQEQVKEKPEKQNEKTSKKDAIVLKEDKKPEKKLEKTPKLKEEIKKPKEEKKQEKKSLKRKNNESELDSLLKTLEESSEGVDEKSKKKARGEKNDVEKENEGEYNDLSPESITIKDHIRSVIENNWRIPSAATDQEFSIKFRFSIKTDGTIENIQLVDKKCKLSPVACQALIESGFRAIRASSPIIDLPSTIYYDWSNNYIEFNPRSFTAD